MSKKSFGLILLLLATLRPTLHAAEGELTVFAAASLTNVLQEVGDAYTAETHQAVRLSFAASSALARQIHPGAPADVFVSADQQWMDYLQSRNLIGSASRGNVVTNALVLVAPASSPLQLKIRRASRWPLRSGMAASGHRGSAVRTGWKIRAGCPQAAGCLECRAEPHRRDRQCPYGIELRRTGRGPPGDRVRHGCPRRAQGACGGCVPGILARANYLSGCCDGQRRLWCAGLPRVPARYKGAGDIGSCGLREALTTHRDRAYAGYCT